MAHLVIDGYNFMSRFPVSALSTLELRRDSFLNFLARYKKETGSRITVVFDAHSGISPVRQKENYKGIDIVYSRQLETADDVIIEWIREKRSGFVVVTSDRAIIDIAKSKGIAFMTPVRLAGMMAGSSHNDETDEDDYVRLEKRGNPKKLPKRLRNAVKTVNKIKR